MFHGALEIKRQGGEGEGRQYRDTETEKKVKEEE